MAGPDLSFGQAAVENLMEDTCVIYPPGEPRDLGLGEDLRLVPAAAPVPLYGTEAEPAKFKMKPADAQAQSSVVAGQALDTARYRIDLPISAPFIPAGSILVVKSSKRMLTAVGTSLTVGDPSVKTLAVQASYAAKRQQRTES